MTKYIFVLGGVISGLGKGVTSGSIGAILKEMGYEKITIKKLDPYLNVDPGTLNPLEHGEVYVTNDGGETDLDLGYYERFSEIEVGKNNSVSSGKLMWKLLTKERKGDFLGKTVQLIPHYTNEIKNFIMEDSDKYDVIICEVGGSAGDYEAASFFEAIRQLKQEKKSDVMICLVTLLLFYKATNELKTKPTQVAIRELMTYGLKPDLLFARAEHDYDEALKTKLSLTSNVDKENIIKALNVKNIYQVPLEYMKEGLIQSIESNLGLTPIKKPTFEKWNKLNEGINKLRNKIKLGIVGKYVELKDAYYSVLESIKHAGWYYSTSVEIIFINAREKGDVLNKIKLVNCVLVPGGFGSSGIEEIIIAIKYCRENLVPFMGICLGMQLSVIEFMRNVVGVKNASSKEFGKLDDTHVIDLMTEWKTESGDIEKRNDGEDLGGTLRLGAYDTVLKGNTLAYKLYEKLKFKERHRHRYEVNIKFRKDLEDNGMIISGLSPDEKLPEIIEIVEYILDGNLIKHPYFIATQFHPEFNSNPFRPHPVFMGLLESTLNIVFKN